MLVSCVALWGVPGLFLQCSQCFSLILHFGVLVPHPIEAVPFLGMYLLPGAFPTVRLQSPCPNYTRIVPFLPEKFTQGLGWQGGGGLDLLWTEAPPPPSHWSPLPRVLTCKCFLSPILSLLPSPFPPLGDLKWSPLPPGTSTSMPVLHTLPFSRVLRN